VKKINWEFWLTLVLILFPMILISATFTNAEEISSDDKMLFEEVVHDLYLATINCDPKDITKVTNLKPEHYEHLVDGTWWEGNEKALMALEQKYGINAIFAMAVSSLESGYGSSSKAKKCHNYYGLMTKRTWESLHHNTSCWGDLMSTKYVANGKCSVDSIAKMYCPVNTSKWIRDVRILMRRFHKALLLKLDATRI